MGMKESTSRLAADLHDDGRAPFCQWVLHHHRRPEEGCASLAQKIIDEQLISMMMAELGSSLLGST